MNALRVLLTVFVCYIFCCPTWSSPVHQTTAEEWDQQIKEQGVLAYSIYLGLCIAAASSGKNFFERQSLSEDCVRTARVTMNLLTTPSTYRKTGDLMVPLSFEKTFQDQTPNQNPTEVHCQKLNEAAKQYNISNFEELKSKVVLPKPAKNYFMQVPQNTNLTIFMNEPNMIQIDDEEILKLGMIMNFHPTPVSGAVFALAEENAYKSTADAVFARACDDYVKKTLKKEVYFTDDNVFTDFIKKVDESFKNDSTLKAEYVKLLEQKTSEKNLLNLKVQKSSDKKEKKGFILKVSV